MASVRHDDTTSSHVIRPECDTPVKDKTRMRMPPRDVPGFFEQWAYLSTCVALGAYYKTYGAGTPTVEQIVRSKLNDSVKQWKSSLNPSTPLVVEDEQYNYVSGRFPGDAQALANRVVEICRSSDA